MCVREREETHGGRFHRRLGHIIAGEEGDGAEGGGGRWVNNEAEGEGDGVGDNTWWTERGRGGDVTPGVK